tara:strand:+ start:2430 stop:2675 length:246 start_codon:yes stop_codon:yes gene_type:complete
MSNQIPSQDFPSDEGFTPDVILQNYEIPPEEEEKMIEEWNELLEIANDNIPVPGQAEMLWEAEKKKARQQQKRTSFLEIVD